ncbi:MAG TPA: hypothetical protein DIC36_04755 [Gammaproteobacteria bacterium]|jgi:hypothetical protein|nr:hypothetical protein [Gammaproteobacteria bacterium]
MPRSLNKTDSLAAHALVPFRVARVEKTSPPDGGSTDIWYRYVLDNGRSTITGLRQGPLKEVTAYAERCAEQINARGQGKTSMWAPRGRKPAGATPPATES